MQQTAQKTPLAPAAKPIAADEFARLMDGLRWRGDALAVAVSGGPDSMALALLLQEWTAKQNIKLTAFTVDHALRAESAAEAAQVGQWFGARGIAHEILRWEHQILSANQNQARGARYRLLAAACARHGITALALAHQLEDQAETVLMRLAKGSGIDGLAAMRAVQKIPLPLREGLGEGFVTQENPSPAKTKALQMQSQVFAPSPARGEGKIIMLRPLLTTSKARLIATCAAQKQDFIRDPSNQAQRFARGRMRQVMEALAAEGMDADRMGDLAMRAGLASDALADYTQRLLARAARYDDAGYAELDLDAVWAEPPEIQARAIGAVLMQIGGEIYAPKHQSLMDLLHSMRQTDMPRRTLHGCEIVVQGARGRIIREYAAIRDRLPIQPGETLSWDHRFHVTLSVSAPSGLILAPLGEVPHAEMDRIAPGLRQKVPMGRVRAAMPAFLSGKNLHAVPGWGESGQGSAIILPRI